MTRHIDTTGGEGMDTEMIVPLECQGAYYADIDTQVETQIRPFNVRDLGAIATFWRHFTKQKDPASCPDIDGWSDLTMGYYQAGVYVCFIAERRGEVVGFIDGTLVYEPAYRQKRLLGRHSWVDEGSRGEGIGRKLYQQLVDYGRSIGVSHFTASGETGRALFAKVSNGNDMVKETELWVGTA